MDCGAKRGTGTDRKVDSSPRRMAATRLTGPARRGCFQRKGMNVSATQEDKWIWCSSSLPPDGEVVNTKIDDGQGCRNVSTLKRQGNLWFFPDGSMYVYYTPTHWHSIEIGGEGI